MFSSDHLEFCTQPTRKMNFFWLFVFARCDRLSQQEESYFSLFTKISVHRVFLFLQIGHLWVYLNGWLGSHLQYPEPKQWNIYRQIIIQVYLYTIVLSLIMKTIHLSYPGIVWEHPSTLMFLDHQMFLKSWLSYHCKLTNQYSNVWSLLKAHIKYSNNSPMNL